MLVAANTKTNFTISQFKKKKEKKKVTVSNLRASRDQVGGHLAIPQLLPDYSLAAPLGWSSGWSSTLLLALPHFFLSCFPVWHPEFWLIRVTEQTLPEPRVG